METMTTLPSRTSMWEAWDKGQRAREFDKLWEAWVAACEKGDKAATKVAAEAHARAVDEGVTRLRASGELARGHSQKPVRCRVGTGDQAVRGHGDDGHRTALDQELKLLFGCAAGMLSRTLPREKRGCEPRRQGGWMRGGGGKGEAED